MLIILDFCLQKKFNLSIKSKGQVLKWMGVTLRNFRSELVNDFVLPNKEDIQSLRLPPIEYPCIKKADWKCFVDRVLSEEFQVSLSIYFIIKKHLLSYYL